MGILSYARSVPRTSPLDSFGGYFLRAAPSGSLFRSGTLPHAATRCCPLPFQEKQGTFDSLASTIQCASKAFCFQYSPARVQSLLLTTTLPARFPCYLFQAHFCVALHPSVLVRTHAPRPACPTIHTPSPLNPARKIKSFHFPRHSAFLEKKRGVRGGKENLLFS